VKVRKEKHPVVASIACPLSADIEQLAEIDGSFDPVFA
jgi:hypothetical protein